MGEKGAAYALGFIYRYGPYARRYAGDASRDNDAFRDVAVNKTEALKWHRVAVELGATYAQDEVDALEAELAAA